MVVDELVARLGFKTTGLGELRKFESALTRMKGGLKGFGAVLNRAFGSGLKADVLSGLSGVSGKLGPALRSSTALAGSLAKGLAGIGLVAAGVAGGIGLIVGALFKMASAFVRARGEAAQMRRELQLTAEAQRTKAVNIEKVGRGIEAIGANPDDAKEIISGLAKKVADGINEGSGKGGKGGLSEFKEAGLDPLEKNGVRRDPAAIALEGIKKFLDRQVEARDLRDKEKVDRAAGRTKAADAKAKKANPLEIENSKLLKFLGVTEQLEGALRRMKDFAEFESKMDRANRDNPTRTQEQEDRASRIADAYTRLKNSLDGITEGLLNPLRSLGDTIAEKVIPPLQSFADAITAFMKRTGLLPETAKEKTEREEKTRQVETAPTDNRLPKAGEDPLVRRAKDMLPNERPSLPEHLLRGSGAAEEALRGVLDTVLELTRKKRNLEEQGASGPGLDKINSQLTTAMNELAAAISRLEAAQKAEPRPTQEPNKPTTKTAPLPPTRPVSAPTPSRPERLGAPAQGAPLAAAVKEAILTIPGMSSPKEAAKKTGAAAQQQVRVEGNVAGQVAVTSTVKIDGTGLAQSVQKAVAEVKGALKGGAGGGLGGSLTKGSTTPTVGATAP